jgi:phosphoribosylaminoimidazole-succinocarboxamide synthase
MYWFDNAVVYHIYPFGYVGRLNAGASTDSPILRVIKHIPVIKSMGFNAIYFGPVFDSTRHGYDTADYTKIDPRLGTNEDFATVCRELKTNGIRIILDGVFNHVGRDFWAFRDIKTNGLGSRYASWFHVREGNSGYNDGFFYEGWEGHYDLVKLNQHNPDVKNHIKDAITGWFNEFGIDGLRLDVAYCLEGEFLRELRRHCKALKPDFWLMGETLHGDYNVWMNPEMLDSVTNYQCYKGLYSSFNDLNMYEIAHSVDRMGGLYGDRGKNLYIFVDNHDVGRIASVLKRPEHLIGLHTLLFTMPGVPGVYYGSEYGMKGDKSQGDDVLRPEFNLDEHKPTPLTEAISKLAKAHATLAPLYAGDYKQVVLTNQYYAFSRSCNGETVYSLINASGDAVGFRLGGSGMYADALGSGVHDIGGEVKVPAYGSMVLFQGSTAPKFFDTAEPAPEPDVPAPPPVIPAAPEPPVAAPVLPPPPVAPQNELKLIFEGKTKSVYDLGDGNYLFRFKDSATGADGVFDPGANQVIGEIAGKGKAGLKLSAFLFTKINQSGFLTHYVASDADKAEMTVFPAKPFGKGIEVICRYKAAGSFLRRYGAYVGDGAGLDALVEVTLKDDERGDPPATKETLSALGILAGDEYENLVNLAKSISGVIRNVLSAKGLELIDIKLEFGRDKDGRVMLIDEVSGDCMRVTRDGKAVAALELESIIL